MKPRAIPAGQNDAFTCHVVISETISRTTRATPVCHGGSVTPDQDSILDVSSLELCGQRAGVG